MNKVKFLMFALVAMAATACVADPTMEESAATSTEVAAAKKIVNTSDGALSGEIILYVDEQTAEAWWNAAEPTRSGNVALDAIAAEMGAKSIEPVFSMNIDGDAKRERGMHRWFIVEFDDEQDVDAVATRYASMSEVQRVQFNRSIEREKSAAKVANEQFTTRADDFPFNDPMLPLQWHYNNTGRTQLFAQAKSGEDIGAFGAWKHTTGNREVVVAVVDEGVKYSHPDLAANMWVNERELNGNSGVDDDNNGWVDDIYGVNTVRENGEISWAVSAWSKDGDYLGDTGHGTHVAGTIAAVNNNGIGVAGVAGGNGNGGVRLMSVQIFDGADNAGAARVAKGIVYAADNGACILQNSWGYPEAQMTDNIYSSYYSVELDAINYFQSKSNCSAMDGGVVIFAAGNSAAPYSEYPGGYSEIISVTSYAPDGLPTTYTNYGPGCNVAAPGGEGSVINGSWSDDGTVLSTIPSECPDPYNYGNTTYGEDYGYMQGTSMACPHVSGVAALVLSYAVENGIKLDNKELYEILTSSVRNIDIQLEGNKTVYQFTGRGYREVQMSLAPYKGQMGTGKVDALLAIMNMRGATCVPTVVGEELQIDLGKLIGSGDLDVTVRRDFDIPSDVKERLGITGETMFGNRVILTCTKAGVGAITIKFIAGGENAGGGDVEGGKVIEKEVVIIARDNNNDGGWL